VPAVIERQVSDAEARKLDRVLDPFEQAAVYLDANCERLLDEYEDEWVAIHRNRVVAHSPTRLGLKRHLNRQSRSLAQVYVVFLTRKKQTLIL
jgi:N-acetylglutamate synthase-like GNAT family acetyltransferase